MGALYVYLFALVFGVIGYIDDYMKVKKHENTGLTDTVDPQSDLGVSRQTILDQSKAQWPKIIMAASDEEFDQLVADMLQFAKDNNVDEICASYQGRHDSNIEVQGFSAYDPEYDVYKLNG